MITPERLELVEQYRAGIDAELHLLDELRTIAEHQHEASQQGDLTRFHTIADRRDSLMRDLVAVEEGLRAVRADLAAHPDVPGAQDLAARHRDVSEAINHILTIDRQSMNALADAELARRSALTSLERGETTLAAYRRVLAPPPEHARLVNRVG